MKGAYQVLVIYDITDNRRRNHFAKKMNSYGCRVQRSAFELTVTKTRLKGLLQEIPCMIKSTEDNVRVYELTERSLAHCLGVAKPNVYEEVMIV